MKVTVDIPQSEINKAINSINRWQKRKLAEIKTQVVASTENVRNKAMRNCPEDTSYLKHSIKTQYSGDGKSGEVGIYADYAEAVELGSRSHIIRVKNAKVLSDGERFFGKEVKHPGTKAQPFLFPAYEEERPNFIKRLLQIIGRK